MSNDTNADEGALRAVTARELADRYEGTSKEWWNKRFPELCKLGVTSRHGRKHFTTFEAIDRWLAGEVEA